MKWHKIKDDTCIIPINTTVLVTDGYEVFPAFIDSMLEWRFTNQDVCSDHDFDVFYWMLFPNPPTE